MNNSSGEVSNDRKVVGDEEFRRKLKEYGFNIVEMEGDGSCFYHALVQGLQRHQLTVEKLRRVVHEEVQSKRDDYKGMFEGQWGRSSDEEMDSILDNSHWADHQDICILAIALKCRVIIFQAEFLNPLVIEHQEVQPEETVYVSRHNQNHYNLLLPRTDGDEDEVEMEGTNFLTQINTHFNGRDVKKMTSHTEEESISVYIDENVEESQMKEYQNKCDIGDKENKKPMSNPNFDDWIVLFERKKGRKFYYAIRQVVQSELTVTIIIRHVQEALDLNRKKYENMLSDTLYVELTERDVQGALIYLELVVFAELFNAEIRIHSLERKIDVLSGDDKPERIIHLRRHEDWSFDILVCKTQDCNSTASGDGWYRSCVKGCSYSHEDFLKVKLHIEVFHGIKVYKCLDCKGQVYKDIVFHEKYVHQNKQMCKLCNIKFRNHYTYITHLVSHNFEMGLSEVLFPVDEKVESKDLVEAMNELYIGSRFKLIEKKGYLVMYDEDHKRIVFTFTSLTQQQIQMKAVKNRKLVIKDEPNIVEYSAVSIGFLNFDCGHLIAAEDMKFDVKSFEDCFSVLNISPMNAVLNSGTWKAIETHVRNVGMLCNRLHYFSIPVYGSSREPMRACGGHYIHVPISFVKIIFYEKPGEAMLSQAFICENSATRNEKTVSPTNVIATNEEVKQITGLKFLQVEQTWSKSRLSFYCSKPGCRKSFVSKEQFMQHLKTHITFLCTICNVGFETLELLNMHEMNHIKTKKLIFICSFNGCTKKFKTRKEFRLHSKRHTQNKRFICNHGSCGKEFVTIGGLKRHQLTHKRPKYCCKVCGFLCWGQYDLVNHYCRQHPNEPLDKDEALVGEKYIGITNTVKVLKCQECDYKTPAMTLFRHHYEQMHCSKEYVCRAEGCNTKFRTSFGLRRHQLKFGHIIISRS